ncbi:YfcE family phosphodiesterase [Bacillus sp. M6-12]|uniref:metallophosphoesterase family protein n=1 Tax=Bacillus sp. M6-12 TaxID=2054166 RepID=UPI000C788845|nr:metallophosphoesterase [Bacillus sp. M6-12]PLS16909.1 YfcE family phosphodiesterase [Bacillus sp. M6-12]
MKVLIMSDSHGLTDEVSRIKVRHRNEVAGMIHCGDSELSYGSLEMSGFLAVRGNCDFEGNYPEHISQDLAGFRFFITHGHLYNVKMTLMNLSYKAQEENAQIACFGHSHIAGSEMIGDTIFINPGSIRLPKQGPEKTYVILEVNSNEIKVNYYDTEGNSVDVLSKKYIFD